MEFTVKVPNTRQNLDLRLHLNNVRTKSLFACMHISPTVSDKSAFSIVFSHTVINIQDSQSCTCSNMEDAE
jgi:hypothetical protein